MYRGYKIIGHVGNADKVHYHWGDVDDHGRVDVPVGCEGPRPDSMRAYYGSGPAGVPTVEEARAEIDQELGADA
jgi:hypothetical protein